VKGYNYLDTALSFNTLHRAKEDFVMGYKDRKKYHKSLHQQAYERLVSMLKLSESKNEYEKIHGNTDNAIFSIKSYETYKKQIKYFIRWVKQNYPECTSLKKAKQYSKEWLHSLTDYTDEKGYGLSASTIQTRAKAINKLYNIHPGDPEYFDPPIRRREDIKRSRGDVERDKHFSEKNNDEFIKFCRGVGSRRTALGKLKAENLWSRAEMEQEIKDSIIDDKDIRDMKDALETFPDQDYFVHFIKDKGGRSRYAPVYGRNKDKIIERMIDTHPGKKVWEYVPSNADIHSYRADYAVAIYKHYARDIKDIPKNEKILVNGKWKSAIYVCRGDEARKKLDRAAMIKCSKALGHNRESVVADHYLRGL
jgi:hypothetical protein